MEEDQKQLTLAAVELGRRGGKKTAERGSDYFAAIQAKREKRGGGRPKNPPKAKYEGTLKIGELEIPCAVLEDGSRVISQRGFARAMGASTPTAINRRGAGNLPVLLTAQNLSPFIDNELKESAKPLVYRPEHGGSAGYGIRAEVIPKICDVWLKARDSGVLKHNQIHLAKAADVIIRGLAHVGIVALVDEATGYQYVRARTALEDILEKFISTEFRKWAKTFPDDFYRQMFRLRHWDFKEDTVRKTPLVGKLTLDLVYDRLAPGVRQRLEAENPKNEKGYRKHKLFQRLTEDIGDPALRAHLASVITLMKVSDEWDSFIKMMNRALPRFPAMPLFDAATQKALPETTE
jgi:hypothetical protein